MFKAMVRGNSPTRFSKVLKTLQESPSSSRRSLVVFPLVHRRDLFSHPRSGEIAPLCGAVEMPRRFHPRRERHNHRSRARERNVRRLRCTTHARVVACEAQEDQEQKDMVPSRKVGSDVHATCVGK